MANYTKTFVTLTETQKQKIKAAYQNKTGVSLKLDFNQLGGHDSLGLTKAQVKQVATAKRKRTGVSLKLSKTQVSKQGGFLGALLASLAGAILPNLLGGLSGKGLVLPGTRGKGLVLPGTRKAYYFNKPIMGSGLLLGKNSPFKNIPILGLIL